MTCNSYSLPFLHCFGLLFLMISAQSTFMCNNPTPYADGSTYSINLGRVLDHLFHNASLTGFGTYSYGQSPHKVYGLLQCIGNISQEKCRNCSQEAISRLQKDCGNDIGARVWMTYCFLRYTNSSFFSKLDSRGVCKNNLTGVTPQNLHPPRNTTAGLLSNLSNIAPGNGGFASASSAYSLSNGVSGNVYGLAQCLRDISIDDCRSCLSSRMQSLSPGNPTGYQAMSGSCILRFELYPFHLSDEIPPTSSLAGNTPLALIPLHQQGVLALASSIHVQTVIAPTIQTPPTVVIVLPTPRPPVAEVAPSPAHPKAESPANQTIDRSTPSPAGDSPLHPKNSSKRLAIILGISGSAILGIVSVCIFAMRKKMPHLIFKKRGALARDKKDAPHKMLFNKEQIVFSLQTLIEATAGFSNHNKLGEGGFGSVYKGVIRDGQEIAVKKLSARSGQGTKEFMNEVEIVANIQHRNLVKLLGCCVEGDERLLVYEFLPNKSLDTFLFDPMKRIQLDWQKRCNIIAGIARGLLYLHQDSRVRIIHRDIKANNILLDQKLNPKIADFGLARLFPDNETEIHSRVAGTYGYMAPEYAMRGHLSVKADVYSFGVVLLEIVSGRKNTDMNLQTEKQVSSLLEWAWRLHKKGNVLSMVDGAVAESCSEEEASRCIQVGLLCTQADADDRPSMSTVVLMMSSRREPLADPKKPAYVIMGQSPAASRNPCTNFTSMTVLEAR